jgi:hypothetical protein
VKHACLIDWPSIRIIIVADGSPMADRAITSKPVIPGEAGTVILMNEGDPVAEPIGSAICREWSV